MELFLIIMVCFLCPIAHTFFDLNYQTFDFIMVFDSVHWSLVIICIPDKEEESGPIVLHLDSLGVHSPRSVFQNIKR